jgi:hypothetical protein
MVSPLFLLSGDYDAADPSLLPAPAPDQPFAARRAAVGTDFHRTQGCLARHGALYRVFMKIFGPARGFGKGNWLQKRSPDREGAFMACGSMRSREQ